MEDFVTFQTFAFFYLLSYIAEGFNIKLLLTKSSSFHQAPYNIGVSFKNFLHWSNNLSCDTSVNQGSFPCHLFLMHDKDNKILWQTRDISVYLILCSPKTFCRDGNKVKEANVNCYLTEQCVSAISIRLLEIQLAALVRFSYEAAVGSSIYCHDHFICRSHDKI